MKKLIFAGVSLLLLTVTSTESFAQRYVVKREYVVRRAWSPQAKDATVGAGAGALLGALVSKHNRGSGALIGGLIGGGAGYLYGKHRSSGYYENQSEGYYTAYRPHRVYHPYRVRRVYRTYPAHYRHYAPYRRVTYVYKSKCYR
jgi:YMGG-like Gly-zipper